MNGTWGRKPEEGRATVKRLKTRIWLLVGVVAIVTLGLSNCSVLPLLKFKRDLKAAGGEADHLVIDFNTAPEDTPRHAEWSAMPTVSIGGAEKVKEFVDLLEFKVPWLAGHCMCLGEMAFRLSRGRETIRKLTFHHGESLRWCSLKTSTPNFELTESSAMRLNEWLERNGGQTLKDAHAEAHRLHERMKEKRLQEDDTTSQPASEPGLE